MSEYRYEKVLRVPLDDIDLFHLRSVYDRDEMQSERDFLDDMECYVPDSWGYGEPQKFQLSPTREPFVDFVLAVDGDHCGDYGKTRGLYESEKEKYAPKFEKFFPGINMNNVRLVEFCWYDGCEAPDYYDSLNDDFYEEV